MSRLYIGIGHDISVLFRELVLVCLMMMSWVGDPDIEIEKIEKQ